VICDFGIFQAQWARYVRPLFPPSFKPNHLICTSTSRYHYLLILNLYGPTMLDAGLRISPRCVIFISSLVARSLMMRCVRDIQSLHGPPPCCFAIRRGTSEGQQVFDVPRSRAIFMTTFRSSSSIGTVPFWLLNNCMSPFLLWSFFSVGDSSLMESFDDFFRWLGRGSPYLGFSSVFLDPVDCSSYVLVSR